MQFSVERKVVGGFALAFATMLALGAVQYRTVRELVETNRWVAHTDEVLLEIEATLAALSDVMAAGRSYLATGDQAHLQLHRAAASRTQQRLHRLRLLTADNPAEQERLSALEQTVARGLGAFGRVVELGRGPAAAAAVERFDRGEGLDLMEGANRITSEMDAEERHLLAERAAASEAMARRTLALTVLVSGATLAALGLASWMVRRDLRAREAAEEALDRHARELARSNQELQQFAYVASHDLQEPLRMVSSYTELLAQRYAGQLDADANDFIAFAHDGAKRMEQLIQDLLAYSRVHTREVRFEPVDCQSAIERALKNLQVSIEESGAAVVCEPLPAVVGDGAQLTQLFQNLIGNAIKYRSAQAPRIHIRAERRGPEWVFAVRDNGIGIDPQYAQRIFVIFQRLHSHAEYPGTGIGLAIAKKIVERHGGRIWVESQPGDGSTFFFTLPLKIQGGADDPTGVRPPTPEPHRPGTEERI